MFPERCSNRGRATTGWRTAPYEGPRAEALPDRQRKNPPVSTEIAGSRSESVDYPLMPGTELA